MYQEQLANLGLTKTQAKVLDFLFEHGSQKASVIAHAIGQPRGVVYKILEELVTHELAEKIEKDREIARFQASHPSRLEKLVLEQKKSAQRCQQLFQNILPELTSAYNLARHKPGVRFYEGEESIKKVGFDSLTSRTEICSYMDPEMVDRFFKNLNLDYVEQRRKRKILKKILTIDSPFTRERYKNTDPQITTVRFVNQKITPFQTVMQIYDHKISYLILTEQSMIGVIIENFNIYQMHKSIFDYYWEMAKE